ncbi:hypothetical protein Tsubulata_038720 [Turnera subulata]|uniref:DOMON domain-containing protein n=1 Tax=Turnera subulata TaxID=218843 RepID=A0A9Q0F0D4_9ROSI|nr:hypothetical protein Tsubulata_038720 [Turnera subulata]
MASSSLPFLSFPSLLLPFILSSLLISPACSQTCTSQKFNTNKLYANCSDLPTLSSYLHYTYNPSNSSLSIAFVAPPSKPDGWIGWGINPNGTGMQGAQVLVAMKGSGSGAVVVKTFNLASYGEIKEEKLSFDVWDLRAESNGTNFVIFASVKVPEKAESVNQIWQVGGGVTNGVPNKHELAQANKDAKSTLALAAASSGAGGGAIVPSATTNSTSTGGNATGAGYRATGMSVGVSVGLLALVGTFIGF